MREENPGKTTPGTGRNEMRHDAILGRAGGGLRLAGAVALTRLVADDKAASTQKGEAE